MTVYACLAGLLLLAAPAALRAQSAGADAVTDTVCAKPGFRRFDFWAGDWVVRDTTGKVLGHNRVTRDVGGCTLHEHWTSAAVQGGVGESFTARSPYDGRWHQLYIGSGGYILSMSGGFEGDRLIMLVDRGADAKVSERWTWTPLDGSRVRQTSAVSSDGGKTWKTEFDGIYERVSARPAAP